MQEYKDQELQPKWKEKSLLYHKMEEMMSIRDIKIKFGVVNDKARIIKQNIYGIIIEM